MTITGYAAKFHSQTQIHESGGGYLEEVLPGAFAASIGRDDVRAFFNHDPGMVLGRLRAGTLRLEEDASGLRMEITPPDTQLGRDVVELIRRGDVSGASFGFVPVRERWVSGRGEGPDRRELVEVTLRDVSPVTFPAYPETEVSSRSRPEPGEEALPRALNDQRREFRSQEHARAVAEARRRAAAGEGGGVVELRVRLDGSTEIRSGPAPRGGAERSAVTPPRPIAEYWRRLRALQDDLAGDRQRQEAGLPASSLTGVRNPLPPWQEDELAEDPDTAALLLARDRALARARALWEEATGRPAPLPTGHGRGQ